MRRSELLTAATRRPDHHGNCRLTAEHRVDFRRVVDDLVHRDDREVDRHDLDDGSQAQHRGTDRSADESLFGDRGVTHPLGTELGEQAGGDLVGTFEDADLLAHEEDVGIAKELRAQRVVQRLAISDEGHGNRLSLQDVKRVAGQFARRVRDGSRVRVREELVRAWVG